jgi:dTDP-4-dehydrorhamnose 3,5-epimerase
MIKNKIKIFKSKISHNKKGDIIKYLSKNDRFFKKFGEVYFTEIKKGKTKGWNYHKKYTCLLTVPFGKVEFIFIENDIGKKKIITISKKNHSIICVPPKIWFCFKSLDKLSIVANVIDGVHNKKETIKLPIKEMTYRNG